MSLTSQPRVPVPPWARLGWGRTGRPPGRHRRRAVSVRHVRCRDEQGRARRLAVSVDLDRGAVLICAEHGALAELDALQAGGLRAALREAAFTVDARGAAR